MRGSMSHCKSGGCFDMSMRATEAERGTDLNFRFVSELGTDELRRLQSALQGTGYDDVDLDVESAHEASH